MSLLSSQCLLKFFLSLNQSFLHTKCQILSLLAIDSRQTYKAYLTNSEGNRNEISATEWHAALAQERTGRHSYQILLEKDVTLNPPSSIKTKVVHKLSTNDLRPPPINVVQDDGVEEKSVHATEVPALLVDFQTHRKTVSSEAPDFMIPSPISFFFDWQEYGTQNDLKPRERNRQVNKVLNSIHSERISMWDGYGREYTDEMPNISGTDGFELLRSLNADEKLSDISANAEGTSDVVHVFQLLDYILTSFVPDILKPVEATMGNVRDQPTASTEETLPLPHIGSPSELLSLSSDPALQLPQVTTSPTSAVSAILPTPLASNHTQGVKGAGHIHFDQSQSSTGDHSLIKLVRHVVSSILAVVTQISILECLMY